MQRLEYPLLSSYPGILSRRKSDFDYSNNPLLMYPHIQDVTAFTLGQLVLPGRLPFSKPKVNWLLQEKTVKNTSGVAALQKSVIT